MAAKQDGGLADRKQPFDCRGATIDSTRRAYVQCQEARSQSYWIGPPERAPLLFQIASFVYDHLSVR